MMDAVRGAGPPQHHAQPDHAQADGEPQIPS
jgi:hypothetical protein